jgi:ATP-dependent helicase/nuclease subunit B
MRGPERQHRPVHRAMRGPGSTAWFSAVRGPGGHRAHGAMSTDPRAAPPQRTFLGWDAPALPRAAATLVEHYGGTEPRPAEGADAESDPGRGRAGGSSGGAGPEKSFEGRSPRRPPPRELDLRGVVVVTPGARAGRRLGELLLDQAEALGAALTPPRFATLGRLPELLYTPELPLADATAARHAYARALRDMPPDGLAPLFPELPRDASGWTVLGGTVASLHVELGAEGISFREVVRALRRGFPYDDTDRWEVLAEVQERYLGILRRGGLGDRDVERLRALEDGRLAFSGDLWLVGVAELPTAARRMLQALPGTVRALIHAPPEEEGRFDELGCIRVEGWERAHLPLDESRVHVVQRPPHQADALADILRSFGGRYSAEEIVVGVPDPELVPYVERGLAMVEVPHRFAGGTPLRSSGPFQLLEAVADFLDGRAFPAFGNLIRHPDLPGLLDGADPRPEGTRAAGAPGGGRGTSSRPEPLGPKTADPLTIADDYHARHLPASVEEPLAGRDEAQQAMAALLAALQETLSLEALQGKQLLSGWMPHVLGVLVGAYGGTPLTLRDPRGRGVVEAAARIKDAAGRLAGLPQELDQEMTAPEAIQALLVELRGEAIPPDPQREAVELLGWLELPLDDAPAVVVAGFNDRHLPEVLGADPFLPGALRTHLGLPDDKARYARDAYLLSALLHSRDEAHLVAGRLSAAGDPLRPSRLLFAAPDEVVARRILRYLEEETDALPGEPGAPTLLAGSDLPEESAAAETKPAAQPGDARAPQHAAPAAREATRTAREATRFRSPPEDPLRRDGPLLSLSVTDFGSYLRDPYRYALERLLGLVSLDDEAREMDALVFGDVAHQVLERFGRSRAANEPEEEAVARVLYRILDDLVQETFGRRPVPAVSVQVQHLKARLGAFARWQAGRVQDGWRVVCVERYAGRGVPFQVDGEPVLLRGKIDRIDHNPNTGEWAVLDYKTGDAGKGPEETHRKGRGQNKAWVDLQLPLYRKLLAGILNDDDTPVVPPAAQGQAQLGYILLPRDLEATGAAMAQWDADALEGAEEKAREVVRELRKGVFPYDASSPSYPDDPFDALLGRLELPAVEEEGDDDPEEEGEE